MSAEPVTTTHTEEPPDAAAVLTADAADLEFGRQAQAYVDAGYPHLAHLSEDAFRDLLAPLRVVAVRRATGRPVPSRSRAPFVVVLSRALVPVSAEAEVLTFQGRPGFVSADTADIDDFRPTAEAAVPDGTAYLVLDVDRGASTLNWSPDEAVKTFTSQGRSPLTVEEGVAFLTVHPESLEKNNCFQTLHLCLSAVASNCVRRIAPGRRTGLPPHLPGVPVLVSR